MQVFISKPGTIFIFAIDYNRERLLTDVSATKCRYHFCESLDGEI
jgi:hypothetical protein